MITLKLGEQQQDLTMVMRSPTHGWVSVSSTELPNSFNSYEEELVWVLASYGFKQKEAEEQVFYLYALTNDLALTYVDAGKQNSNYNVDYLFTQVNVKC